MTPRMAVDAGFAALCGGFSVLYAVLYFIGRRAER